MSLILGVDTGGTFTDAVLLDAASGTVHAAHKAFTTHENLAVGIEAALRGLPASAWTQVGRAAVSTTLATNAALEGLGSRVGCILIGYDPGVMRHYRLSRHVRASKVAHVAGRHDIFGEEVTPLDEDGLRDAVQRLAGDVDALAVSSYLAPRNPEHEHRALRMARELTDLPVVAGGTFSAQLDSIRRATTATLNAKLLAITGELLRHAGAFDPAARRGRAASGRPRRRHAHGAGPGARPADRHPVLWTRGKRGRRRSPGRHRPSGRGRHGRNVHRRWDSRRGTPHVDRRRGFARGLAHGRARRRRAIGAHRRRQPHTFRSARPVHWPRAGHTAGARRRPTTGDSPPPRRTRCAAPVAPGSSRCVEFFASPSAGRWPRRWFQTPSNACCGRWRTVRST